jgi:pimeloyl-ACP methyl ester carboxylesterase
VQELSVPGALHAFLGLYRALSWDELAQVGDVAVPAVFVPRLTGTSVAGPVAVQRTRELLHPAEPCVHVVDGGHWLPEQEPHAVVREVLALVAQTQPEAQHEDQQERAACSGR